MRGSEYKKTTKENKNAGQRMRKKQKATHPSSLRQMTRDYSLLSFCFCHAVHAVLISTTFWITTNSGEKCGLVALALKKHVHKAPMTDLISIPYFLDFVHLLVIATKD